MDKYGFVYIWYDRKHKRYYIGSHWGTIDDGYVCSSSWMKKAYKIRPQDFSRRILKTNIDCRKKMYIEEYSFLSRIKPHEVGKKYYNLRTDVSDLWHQYDEKIKTVGQKISASLTGRKNKPTAEETKKKISDAKRGAVFSEEHRQKLRQAKLGKKMSAEHRRKISEGMKAINKS